MFYPKYFGSCMESICVSHRNNRRNEENSNHSSETRTRLYRFKPHSKICAILGVVGIILALMGCLVLIEKSKIDSENSKTALKSSTQYLLIAGNVLVGLGSAFIIFSVLQFLYFSFRKTSPSNTTDDESFDPNERPRRVFTDVSRYAISQNLSTSPFQQHLCSIYTITDDYGEPPNYCDLSKDEHFPPPKYHEMYKNEVSQEKEVTDKNAKHTEQ